MTAELELNAADVEFGLVRDYKCAFRLAQKMPRHSYLDIYSTKLNCM